jgi:hypothetical protein
MGVQTHAMDDVIWRAQPTEPLTKAEEKLLELPTLGMNGQDVATALDIAPDEVPTSFRAFSRTCRLTRVELSPPDPQDRYAAAHDPERHTSGARSRLLVVARWLRRRRCG